MDGVKSKEVKRSQNFKQCEIDLLLNLAETQKDVIECKKTDHVNKKLKDSIWLKIENLFNQQSDTCFRDWKTLKGKYDNLKKTSKRKWADEKKYVSGTGGGPSFQTTLITPTDIKIKELLGEVQVNGNFSIYDSDAPRVQTDIPKEECHSNINILGLSLPVMYEEEVITNANHNCSLVFCPSQEELDTSETGPSTKQICDEEGFGGSFSVQDLRKKTSSPLKMSRPNKRKRSLLDSTQAGKKLEAVAKAKQELIELQSNVFTEQAKLQKIEHDVKVKCMQEEHLLKMKQMQEQHEEQLKLIRLKIKNEELDLAIKTEMARGGHLKEK